MKKRKVHYLFLYQKIKISKIVTTKRCTLLEKEDQRKTCSFLWILFRQLIDYLRGSGNSIYCVSVTGFYKQISKSNQPRRGTAWNNPNGREKTRGNRCYKTVHRNQYYSSLPWKVSPVSTKHQKLEPVQKRFYSIP